ncbi:MAG: Tfp pilus assembly protein PilW [Candidatus Binatia bacterium]|jgi:Tfp pilus assembly protein PilW
MDFKTISTDRRRLRRRGASLVELLVSVGISGMVLAVIAVFMMYTARSFASLDNYLDLDVKSRLALDRMSREIRQADGLTSFATNQLVFAYTGTNLTFAHDAVAKTLTRSFMGTSETLLEGCDELTFSIFQRNPINGSFEQYPTASADTAKLIQLDWVCSREIMGQTANTESVQSAKIVIRK